MKKDMYGGKNVWNDMFEPNHNGFDEKEGESVFLEVLAVTILCIFLTAVYLFATK